MSQRKQEIFEQVVYENAVRNHLDHDMVVIHDPQPLPMIRHYKKHGPWMWRYHVDLSHPHADLWTYLRGFVEEYDAVITSSRDYQQRMDTPQRFFLPAIDPFSIKNHDLDEAEIDERLAHYEIPADLPLVVQISRFDRRKDPQGVIEAMWKGTPVIGGNVGGIPLQIQDGENGFLVDSIGDS